MLTRTWDNIAIKKDFSNCANLSEILFTLDQQTAKTEEVICEVRVNGNLLTAEDEARLGPETLDNVSELSVKISSATQVIAQARESSLSLVGELIRACHQTSDLLRHGDLQAANRRFTEIVDATNWLVQTLIHLKGATRVTDSPDATRWLQAEENLEAVISDVCAAYQRQDLNLVADLLEYELTGALDGWKIELDENRGASQKIQPRDS